MAPQIDMRQQISKHTSKKNKVVRNVPKVSGNFQMRSNVYECIQIHPNTSEYIRTGPKTFEKVTKCKIDHETTWKWLSMSEKIPNLPNVSECVRTRQDASACIQTHPNASKHIQTHPNMSENMRKRSKSWNNYEQSGKCGAIIMETSFHICQPLPTRQHSAGALTQQTIRTLWSFSAHAKRYPRGLGILVRAVHHDTWTHYRSNRNEYRINRIEETQNATFEEIKPNVPGLFRIGIRFERISRRSA